MPAIFGAERPPRARIEPFCQEARAGSAADDFARGMEPLMSAPRECRILRHQQQTGYSQRDIPHQE